MFSDGINAAQSVILAVAILALIGVCWLYEAVSRWRARRWATRQSKRRQDRELTAYLRRQEQRKQEGRF